MKVKLYDIVVVNDAGNKRAYKGKTLKQKRTIERHLTANKQRVVSEREYYVQEGTE